jgi:hypothetical protein
LHCSLKVSGMNESVNRAESQLMAIEQIHGIKFLNREEVAARIAEGVADEGQILLVCTGINLWAAGNELKEEVRIPDDLVATLLEPKGRHRAALRERRAKAGVRNDRSARMEKV